MAKAIWTGSEEHRRAAPAIDRAATDRPAIDWRKQMSDHVAYALLVYTALQIFVAMTALKGGHGSILPYFGLVVLVGAIIPLCRVFERRWEVLDGSGADDAALAGRFRRDAAALWLCAIGLPLALAAGFKGVAALF